MHHDAIALTESRLGKAWDEWRVTRATSGHLWFVEQGGIDSLCVNKSAPSEDHVLVTPEDVGWLSREQFMARMTLVARRLPLLNPSGNYWD